MPILALPTPSSTNTVEAACASSLASASLGLYLLCATVEKERRLSILRELLCGMAPLAERSPEWLDAMLVLADARTGVKQERVLLAACSLCITRIVQLGGDAIQLAREVAEDTNGGVTLPPAR